MRIGLLLLIVCISLFEIKAQELKLVYSVPEDISIQEIGISKDSTFYINEFENLENGEKISRIYKSTDLGANWEIILARESSLNMKPVRTFYFNYISPINKDSLVLFGSQGVNFITTDGGLTWDSSYVDELAEGKIIDFARRGDELAFLMEGTRKVFYSKDCGLTYEILKVPSFAVPPMPMFIAFDGEGQFTVYNKISDTDSTPSTTQIHKYNNGTWSSYDTLPRTNYYEFYHLKNGNILYVNQHQDSLFHQDSEGYCIYSYKLYDQYYNKLGKYFENIVNTSNFFSPSFSEYEDKILITCNDTIWVTNDDGTNWSYFEKDLQEPSDKLYLEGVDLLDNGFGIYKDNKSVYLFNPNPTSVDESKTEDNSISIYPNPSSDFVSISSEEEGLEEIILFDVQGREVGRFDVGSKIQDVTYLESGTYYLRFSYKDKIKIRQLVISR